MRIALFADGLVGQKIIDIFRRKEISLEYLILNKKAPNQLDFSHVSITGGVFTHDTFVDEIPFDSKSSSPFDLGILCWWPYIIKKELLNIAQLGFLNFHPSLLPFGRGKNPNFWTFVDQTPFGVTIHWVDESIDGGDVAYQEEIPVSWLDNGQTLYEKSLSSIVSLFEKNILRILSNDIPKLSQASCHKVRYARELEPASEIKLGVNYKACDLLNLLRARTFNGYPGCWFVENGCTYRIKISIEVENSNG